MCVLLQKKMQKLHESFTECRKIHKFMYHYPPIITAMNGRGDDEFGEQSVSYER